MSVQFLGLADERWESIAAVANALSHCNVLKLAENPNVSPLEVSFSWRISNQQDATNACTVLRDMAYFSNLTSFRFFSSTKAILSKKQEELASYVNTISQPDSSRGERTPLPEEFLSWLKGIQKAAKQ